MEYFIYMTNDCNLNCHYCSVLVDAAKAGIPTRPNYSNNELVELIDKTQNSENDSEATVYFFGGEPSLEYESIIKLINDIKKHLNNYALKFILHTNGLLLHKMPCNLLNQLTAILCSINYEKIPKYNLSNSYFSVIVNNVISTKKRKNLNMLGRMTITEKTSLYTELLQFAHFFDYIYWQIENTANFKNFKQFYATYTYELRLTFDYWLQYLGKGILLKYIPFMSAMRFLLWHDKPDTAFSCGYGAKMIYLQTDGSCYACSDSDKREMHSIGNISDGVNLPKPNLAKLRCSRCRYRQLCLGRCGRMHKEFSKKQVSRYCALNKFMFNLFILHEDKLENIVETYPFLESELKAYPLDFTEFTP
jgi:uncharacterized protein